MSRRLLTVAGFSSATIALTLSTIAPAFAADATPSASPSASAIEVPAMANIASVASETTADQTAQLSDGFFVSIPQEDGTFKFTNVSEEALKDIQIKAEKTELTVGDEVQLIAHAIKPNDELAKLSKYTLVGTYSTSDEKVLKVSDNGLVTATGVGTATITFKPAYWDATQKKVIEKDLSYTIKLTVKDAPATTPAPTATETPQPTATPTPAATTPAPVATTPAPVVTTTAAPSPSTTTAAPAPVVTTPAPVATTAAPAPSATTAAPSPSTTTAAPAPVAATPAPAASTAAPAQAAPVATPEPEASFAYANCKAAKADGAYDLHPGDYGWQEKLDRDNDKVGCESGNGNGVSGMSDSSYVYSDGSNFGGSYGSSDSGYVYSDGSNFGVSDSYSDSGYYATDGTYYSNEDSLAETGFSDLQLALAGLGMLAVGGAVVAYRGRHFA